MAPFVPPEPPLEPDDPTPPPALTTPLPPPEVGEGSPWAPIDAENRDRILDWWRMWFRRVFFPWIKAWGDYWAAQWARIIDYLNEWLDYAGEYIELHAVAGYSWRKTDTPLNATGTTTVELIPYDQYRPILIGDLVSDTSEESRYGQVSALVDDTHAVVTTLGSLRGLEGLSWWVTATDITTDPTTVVLEPADDPNRQPQLGDLVSDQSITIVYGQVVEVIDDTHVSVSPIGSLRGLAGFGWWTTETAIAHAGTTAVVLTAGNRSPQINDLVVDNSSSHAYGVVTVVTDDTHVTVAYAGTLQGPQGDPGGGVESVVAGTNVTVDSTDPANPIVSATNGGGVVETIVAGTNITVDDTDPANPVVSASGGGGSGIVESIVAGDNIGVDSTDPANPIVSATGVVESVVAGSRISVDSTDPANPIVGTANGIPLNVYTTAGRPDALVNGDAYFDSDLLIPVWSYGGVWRDSEGTPVEDPVDVDIDVVSNVGGTTPTLVSLTPIADADPFFDVIQDRGVAYGGDWYIPYADVGFEATTHIMDKFDGSTMTPVNLSGITLKTYNQYAGMWVEGGAIHIVFTTASSDFPVTDPETIHVTYDGSSFTQVAVTPALAALDTRYVLRSSTGYYLDSGWTSDLASVAPSALDSVGTVNYPQVIGSSLYQWGSSGTPGMYEFPGTGTATRFDDIDDVIGNAPCADSNGIGKACIVYAASGHQVYTGPSSPTEATNGLQWIAGGGGSTDSDSIYICDPADPLGDHVEFTIGITGGPGIRYTAYFGGHAYILLADADENTYMAKVAVSVGA